MGAVTRAWWRRNAVALIALPVLVALALGGMGGWEWWKQNQAEPIFPVTAAAGESIEFGDVTWGPATASVQTPSIDADMPPGAQLLAVEIPVDRHGEPTACSVRLLREVGGAERSWEADALQADWDYRKHTFCPTDPTADSYPAGRFSLEVPFFVPADATGPFEVEVVLSDELPRVLRLEVTP
jgi:hypothetical protein